MSETLGEAVVKVTGDASGANAAIDATQRHLGASIFVFRTAGYALQSIGQAALTGFKDATDASADFNATLVKTANLTSIADFDLNKVHDTLLRISKETAQSPKELADGFYFAASVLNNLNDALMVTEVAAKGSAIGLGSVSEVTRTLTSVMNVYGLHAADVNHIMDTLIIAVKDGAGEASAFAGALGRIIPIAKVAGVSFEDISAALATATRAGLSVDEAVTAVNRVLVELIGSSQQTNKELYTLGFSSTQIDQAMAALATTTGTITQKLQFYGLNAKQASQVLKELETNTGLAEQTMRKYGLTKAEISVVEQNHEQAVARLRAQLVPFGLTLQDIDQVLKTYSKDTEEGQLALGKYGISSQQLRDTLKGPDGLYNAMTLIMEKTQGNDAELRRIFPNIRGFIGILATAGTQGAEYKSILDEMHTSLGVVDADFAKTAATQQFAQERAKATLETLQIKVGESLAPALISTLNALQPLLEAVGSFADNHPTAFKNIVEGLLGLATATYAIGAAAQGIAAYLAVSRGIAFIAEGLSKVPFIMTGLRVLATGFTLLGGVLIGPVGIILAIVALVAILAALLIFDVGGIRTRLVGAFQAIWAGLVVAVGEIGKSIGHFVSWVGSLFSALGTKVHGALMSLWGGITDIWNAIVSTAERAWADFASRPFYWIARVVFWIPGQLYQLQQHLAVWFVEALMYVATWAASTFIAFTGWLTKLPGEVGKWLAGVYTSFLNWGNDTLHWVGKTAGELWTTIVNTVSALPGEIGKWLGQIVSDIPVWKDKLVNAGIDAFVGFIGGIQRLFQNTDWAGLGRMILIGIAHGIYNMVQGMGNLLGGAKDQILQAIRDDFGISSPSIVMANLVGKPIVEGIVKGIVDNAALVRGALRGVLPAINATGSMSLSSAAFAGAGAAAAGSAGLNIGSMVIQNPQSEVDLISALQRQQYLARMMGDRGISPPVIKS